MTAMWLDDPRIAVARDTAAYSASAPYDPSEPYPEWDDARIGSGENPAFRAVRRAFLQLGLDGDHQGTREWSPLRDVVSPGTTVVLKPNLVTHRNHGERAFGLTDTDSLVTHGSVVRAVVDYVAKALRGSGRIVIGDCPLQGADWDGLMRLTGLPAVAADAMARFPGITCEVKDYRLGRAKLWNGYPVERHVDEGARANYQEVDLGSDSLLVPLMGPGVEFGVSHYPRHRMRAAHTPTTNKYLLPIEMLNAQTFINIPKLKAHQKAAITCSLKNLVGVNGHKDYLPHFRFGSPSQGGDEYPDGDVISRALWAMTHAEWELEGGPAKRALILARRVADKLLATAGLQDPNLREMNNGAWAGNDTLWRTVLDINRAFFYFDRRRKIVADVPSTDFRYLCVVDGLIGGHREAPLAPTPVASGLVLAGFNPLGVDAVATALMGFDVEKVMQVKAGFDVSSRPLARFRCEDVELVGDLPARRIAEVYARGAFVPFTPSYGFRGHIEFKASASDRVASHAGQKENGHRDNPAHRDGGAG